MGQKKSKPEGGERGVGNGHSESRKSSGDNIAEGDRELLALDYHEQLINNVMEGPKNRNEGLGQWRVLPDECILRIFSFLPIEDICCLSCVSKTLFTLGRDDALWKNIYKVRGVRVLFGPDALDEAKAGHGADDNWHKHKRKKKRIHGKWRNICLKNMLLLPEGEPLILNEQILGCSLDRVEELFGQCDEITSIGRGNAYYFFHTVGLSMCCEDSRITAVLKHAPLDSCSGPAYEKIVPLPF